MFYTSPIRLLAAAATACASQFPIVETTSGAIRGFYPKPDLRAFLGIPYAQPPIGSLRFRPPEPVKQKAEGLIDAMSFGFSCYQWRVGIVGATALGPTTGESEDCLTLNVWAADEQHSEHPRPVLVWMHGGTFTEGSTSVPMYDGQYLAAAHPDIIVVTINYRVNVFGFSNSPAVPEKNVGLRDQRLAVEWLRDNIAAFGGDPDKMVLGGESAGAMGTGMYAYAYPNDPIVRGLVMESGEAPTMVPDDSNTLWDSLAEALGCQSSDPMEELTCMQGVDGYTLKRTLSPIELNPYSSPPKTNPTVDNVTYFGPVGYAALGAAGKFASLPALRGINNNEGNALVEFTPDGGPLNQTLADWLTEIGFNCPAAAEAGVWATHEIPSWRYRYFGEFPSLMLYDWMGAYHGSEVAVLLGTIDNVRVRGADPSEREAQKYFQEAVVSFIKDPIQGLEDFGWPVYNPNTTSLVELFKDNLTHATFAEGAAYDGACPSF